MKIWLGEEGDSQIPNKIAWIKDTFDKDSYDLSSEGFIYYDYFVTFSNSKHATLFWLRWTKDDI